MIRGAAKNHASVVVHHRPRPVRAGARRAADARDGTLSRRDALPAGREAFRRTAQYDAAIAAYLREPGAAGAEPRRRRASRSASRSRRARPGAPLRREPAPGRRVLPAAGAGRSGSQRGRPAPRPGARLQQPARLVGRARPAARVRRSGRGRDQAHQPVRRGPRAGAWARPCARAKACDPVSIYGGIVGREPDGSTSRWSRSCPASCSRSSSRRRSSRTRSRSSGGRRRSAACSSCRARGADYPARASEHPERARAACSSRTRTSTDLDPARSRWSRAAPPTEAEMAGAALRLARRQARQVQRHRARARPSRWSAWARGR